MNIKKLDKKNVTNKKECKALASLSSHELQNATGGRWYFGWGEDH